MLFEYSPTLYRGQKGDNAHIKYVQLDTKHLKILLFEHSLLTQFITVIWSADSEYEHTKNELKV